MSHAVSTNPGWCAEDGEDIEVLRSLPHPRPLHPRVDLPADAGASDRDGHVSFLELLSLLDALESRSSLAYPQVMLRVCEDANVGLGRGDGC